MKNDPEGQWILELIHNTIRHALEKSAPAFPTGSTVADDYTHNALLLLWRYQPQHGAFIPISRIGGQKRNKNFDDWDYPNVFTTDTGHLSFALRTNRTLYAPSLLSSPRSRRLTLDMEFGLDVVHPTFVTPFVANSRRSAFVCYLCFPYTSNPKPQTCSDPAMVVIYETLERIRLLISEEIERFFDDESTPRAPGVALADDVTPTARLREFARRIVDAPPECRIGAAIAFAVDRGVPRRTQTYVNPAFLTARWIRVIRRGSLFHKAQTQTHVEMTAFPDTPDTPAPTNTVTWLPGLRINTQVGIGPEQSQPNTHPALRQHLQFSTFLRVEIRTGSGETALILNLNLGKITAIGLLDQFVNALGGLDARPIAQLFLDLRHNSGPYCAAIYQEILFCFLAAFGPDADPEARLRKIQKRLSALLRCLRNGTPGGAQDYKDRIKKTFSADILGRLCDATRHIAPVSVAVWHPGPMFRLRLHTTTHAAIVDAVFYRTTETMGFRPADDITRGQHRDKPEQHAIWLFKRRRELGPLVGFLEAVARPLTSDQTHYLGRVVRQQMGTTPVDKTGVYQWILHDDTSRLFHTIFVGTQHEFPFTHWCLLRQDQQVALVFVTSPDTDPSVDDLWALLSTLPDNPGSTQPVPSSALNRLFPSVAARFDINHHLFDLYGMALYPEFADFVAKSSLKSWDRHYDGLLGAAALLPTEEHSLDLAKLRKNNRIAPPLHNALWPHDGASSTLDIPPVVHQYRHLWHEILCGVDATGNSPKGSPRALGDIPSDTPIGGVHLLADNVRTIPLWRNDEYLGVVLVFSGQPSSFGSVQATLDAAEIFAPGSPETRYVNDICAALDVTRAAPSPPLSQSTPPSIAEPSPPAPLDWPNLPPLVPACFDTGLTTPVIPWVPTWDVLPWNQPPADWRVGELLVSGLRQLLGETHLPMPTTLGVCRHVILSETFRELTTARTMDRSARIVSALLQLVRTTVATDVRVHGGPPHDHASHWCLCSTPAQPDPTPCVPYPGWIIGTCALCVVRLKLASLIPLVAPMLTDPTIPPWPAVERFLHLYTAGPKKPHLDPSSETVALSPQEVIALKPLLWAHVQDIPERFHADWDPDVMLFYLLAQDVATELSRQLPRGGKISLPVREKLEKFLTSKSARSVGQTTYFTGRTLLRECRLTPLVWPVSK